jgi:hypothetical protein
MVDQATMTSTRLGATPDEWEHLDLILGLGDDLLPVVANQSATISPNSSIKQLGKVPSKYNGRGEVSGFPAWATHQATSAELAAWQNHADYGACIITRCVRGLDADIPNPVLAHEVETFIAEHLGFKLPKRYRDNSARFLHPFGMISDDPKYGKWVIYLSTKDELDRGIKNEIEFLMGGHHFVACGTHTSGAHIEWAGGLPDSIPEISAGEFEALFDALQARFGKREPAKNSESRVRVKGTALAISDGCAEFLEASELVLGTHDGGLIIACPWESEHGQGVTRDGSTMYFPAGSNGHLDPMFKCLHAHCVNRTLQNFYDAVGYSPDVDVACAGMEHVPAIPGAPSPQPSFQRTPAGGIKASKDNTVLALARADLCGFHIRRDTFRDETMLASCDTDGWRRMENVDYTELCLRLERGKFQNITKELIRDSVAYVAALNTFDSAQHWLGGLAWDGVPRVRGFLHRYLGAADTPYTQAIGLYLWTALAGRVLVPGCKADMVPVLVGAQGTRKTSAVAALVPADDFFTPIDLNDKDDDLSRKMRGKLVIELGELRGLATREAEHIKGFITRTVEEWVPKYFELTARYPRRCVFVGTSNKDDFLADETGERRWLPFVCGMCDPDSIKADRDQLWAEGRELFGVNGVMFHEAETLAGAEHESFTAHDEWESVILAWMHAPGFNGDLPYNDTHVTASAVLAGALGVPIAHQSQPQQRRVKRVLTRLGYKYGNWRIDGRKQRGYEAPSRF